MADADTAAPSPMPGAGARTARAVAVFQCLAAPPPAGSPLVSVVIPCHDYGRFVEEAIASARAQSLRDVEIIAVDDGSTDPATIAVIDRLDRAGAQVLRQPNRGVSSARNAGIERARGKYVCCLDADDVIEPTYLEKAVVVMEARGDVGFVYSWVQYFGGDDTLWRTRPFDLDAIVVANHVSVAAVFRRDLWAAAGGFDPLMRGGYEDWEFWLRLGSLGVVGWCVPEPLMRCRRHGPSMSDGAIERHVELGGRIRALNPEAFDATFRRVVKAGHRPVDAPRPWAWLGDRRADRPSLLVLPGSARTDAPPVVIEALCAALRDTHDARIVAAGEGTGAPARAALSPLTYELGRLLPAHRHGEFLDAAIGSWDVRAVASAGSDLAPGAVRRLARTHRDLVRLAVAAGGASTAGPATWQVVADRPTAAALVDRLAAHGVVCRPGADAG